MPTDLLDHVSSMKRALAVPGTFTELFPSTTDQDLAAVMLDAMGEAQLDGFFPEYSWDLFTAVVDQDLTHAEVALVIIYASHRVLVNEIRNRRNHVRYESGTAVYEQDQTASMLNELLREMRDRKEQLRERARYGDLSSAFYMADLYAVKYEHSAPLTYVHPAVGVT